MMHARSLLNAFPFFAMPREFLWSATRSLSTLLKRSKGMFTIELFVKSLELGAENGLFRHNRASNV
jgi:hypothetical protein